MNLNKPQSEMRQVYNCIRDAMLRANQRNDDVIEVIGYHPDSDVGGGKFYWDSTKAKSDHNGGTVLSPTVPWSASIGDYLDGVGETDGSGFGCWVRVALDSIDIQEFGAIGDGITSSHKPINAAILNSNGHILIPKGDFIVRDTININKGVKLSGVCSQESILRCDKTGGYAIDIGGGFYDKPVVFEDFTLRCKDPVTANFTGGVRVQKENVWGLNLIVSRFTMQYFSSVSWYFQEAFSCKFDDVVTIGVAGYSTLLEFDSGATFNNQFMANNSTFFIGRIGVKNLGCVSSVFTGCTFEALSLFLNVTSLTGYSVQMLFINSWFEIITRGIVNATLTAGAEYPLEPIQNKTNIEGIRFINNYVSASVASPFIDTLVEPEKSKFFSAKDGYQPSKGFVPQIYQYEYENGLPADSTIREAIEDYDLTELRNPTGFGSNQYYTIKVSALVQGGNPMTSLFVMPRVNATVKRLLDLTDDPSGNGVDYKITANFSTTNVLQVSVKARGLYKFNVDIIGYGNLG